MSYILEALKKAEQERETRPVPGLEAAQPAPPEPQPRRWIWAFTGSLLLSAIVIAAAWLHSNSEDKPGEAAIEPVIAAAGKPSPAPAPVQPPPAAKPAPIDAPVSSERGESRPQTATQIAAPGAPAQRPLRSLPLAAPTPAPVPNRTSQSKPVPRNQSAATAAAVSLAHASASTPPASHAAKVAPATRSLPRWPGVPREIANQVNGTLTLNMNLYSDNPGERFVLINMGKYREGQQLEEGPTVERIVPKAVILDVSAGQFLLTLD